MPKHILPVFILLFPLLLACKPEVNKVVVQEDISPVVIDTFSTDWKFRAGEGRDNHWMNGDYDDSSWQNVKSDKLLNTQKAFLENRFGWYRKTVCLSDSLKKSIIQKDAAMIHLGRFGGTDEVYLNGKKIGKTGDFPPNHKGYHSNSRSYLIAKDDINLNGENHIAIKFHDGWNTGGFLGNEVLRIASAHTNDKIQINVAVADSDYVFLSPNPLSITVNLNNKNAWNVDGQLFVNITTDKFEPVKSDSLNITIEGNSISANTFELTDPEPGFYRYTVQFKRDSAIIGEKKLNLGFEPEKISSPVDAKDDFKAFWDNSLKELANVSPNYKLTLLPEHSKIDYEIYLVEMRSFGNELIRGYYAKPKREGKHPVIVEYMGYSSAPWLPGQYWDGFARFILSVRGQALNKPTNRFGRWITYGLKNKETYYYRGAFMDVVRAVDFVCSRPEIDSERIAVCGGSQGGAFSFAAAALDKRVKVAAPTIPFLSDYRDYFKIAGWPKSDFDNYMSKHPEAKWDDIYDLLTYFDIKNLAQWIECPLIMGIGMQDEVCPPHINFAAYNQVKGEKRWMAFPESPHCVGQAYYEESHKFIKEKLNVK